MIFSGKKEENGFSHVWDTRNVLKEKQKEQTKMLHTSLTKKLATLKSQSGMEKAIRDCLQVNLTAAMWSQDRKGTRVEVQSIVGRNISVLQA